jgi:hypothetical protein
VSSLDLNEIVTDELTEDGVAPITKGALLFASLRENLKAVLKAVSPEKYAEYKAVKFPGGVATAESRRAAAGFLLDATKEILLPHYHYFPKA